MAKDTTYSKAIEGLRAKAQHNKESRERAVSMLVRLAASGRQRRK